MLHSKKGVSDKVGKTYSELLHAKEIKPTLSLNTLFHLIKVNKTY